MNALTLFPLADHAPTPIDPRPLIVDSFAGGGGASTGIEMALGRSPDIAINHSESALALHAANHPDTLHLSENVYRVDPLTHLAGRHIGLMWFSPDCKHFSKAKGGAPVKRNIRDLAWIIPGWIERIQKSGGRVDVVLLENVEEFKTWGPLIETPKGLMPDPSRAGETFQAWCKKLRRLGGRIESRELRACDYGAPTIRKRLFVVVRFDKKRIVWPAPTHGNPASPEVKAGKLLPWRTAAECIDWSIPCPSIFDSKAEIKEALGINAVRPLKPNTLARVARGIHRYVLQAEQPFIVNLTNGARSSGGFEYPPRPIIPSIVGCGGRAGQSRPRGGNEPLATVTAKADACLIAPSLTRFNGGATGQDLRDPMVTVTANSWIKKPGGAAPLGVITPLLAELGHSETSKSGAKRWGFGSKPVTQPLATITAGGKSHALVAPLLATMRNSAKPWQGADEPTHTITAGGAGLTLISPILSQMYGAGGGHGGPDRPHPTVTAAGQHAALISPVLTYAQQGGANRSIDAPHHTICASTKDQNSLIAAFLAQQNNDSRRAGGVNPGRAADAPLSTICQTGSHQNLTAAFFAKYYGTGDGARHDEPAHTITVRDRFAHIQADLAAPPFGPEHEAKARQVAQLLREHGLWDDREFVTLTIGGAEFVIVDVGMRMLTPRELFRAQGFPDDYVIEGVWDEGTGWENLGHNGGPQFRAFPKDVQVSCCGNSVCPPLAEALARANCAHLMTMEAAA